jgi:hypothetical protein
VRGKGWRGKDIYSIGPITLHPVCITSPVAFCHSRESRAVAGHPCSQCKESMVDGVWSDKKDKVFVSTMLLVIASDSWCGGTALAGSRE